MSAFLQDYIKRKVFDKKEAQAKHRSNEFYFALLAHATQKDCVSPNFPLDFTQRFHTKMADTNYGVNAAPICPGGDVCVFDNAPFESSVIVFDDYTRTRETYAATEEKCEVAGDCGGCREEGVCVSCLKTQRGTGEVCEMKEGVEREECEASGACVHPNGEIEYGLTENQCMRIQVYYFFFFFFFFFRFLWEKIKKYSGKK